MRRLYLVMLTLSCVTFVSGTAQAGWHEFWESVKLDTHRNLAWPEPFQTLDRRATLSHFAAMQQKGWKLETTISDYHFDQETERLTEAGRRKVRWILTEAPPQRRMVYVLISENEEATANRVDSVQRAISQMIPKGPLPPVIRTHVAPRGASAVYVQGVYSRAAAARPDPVLPEDSGEADSGG
jgi:hypothetical protein